MKNLDDLIKQAKPEVPSLPNDFSQKTLAYILNWELTEKKRVQSTSKYQLGHIVTGLVLLISALILTNIVIFEVQMNGSLEMLSLGTDFIAGATGYFPFDLVIPVVLMTTVASWLLWRSRLIKKSIATIVTSCFLITNVGGTALASTSLNEQIQDKVVNNKNEIPIISQFYRNRAIYLVKHPNFEMGQVTELKGKHATIKTPHGKVIDIFLPKDSTVIPGQYFRFSGQKTDTGFQAKRLQHCRSKRGDRYFTHMENMKGHMGKKMQQHHNSMH
ncbi:MAG: hypothetical protein HOD92_07725 [Deltaproteobacteria bacterium]|jgi:hypothetical protein|nr:hypothetical protein [Deltaproteobacteria bacterium]MBT4526070.1 hypothetical protein [Deltaproteobacteria bacterium]